MAQKAVNEPGDIRFDSNQPSYKVRARSPRNGLWVWLSLNENEPGFDRHSLEHVWAKAVRMVEGDEPPAALEVFEVRCVRRWDKVRGIQAR